VRWPGNPFQIYLRAPSGQKGGSVKISIRKKVVLAFTVFVLIGGLIWFLNYYKHHLLNLKLQIIEKKQDLFNTILEARRYEKNYFLFLDVDNLRDALSYTRQAEKKLLSIIERYHKYTLAGNLEENLRDLKNYEQSLVTLLSFYQQSGVQKMNENLIKNFSARRTETRELGRKITDDMEHMVREEHKYVTNLIKDSSIYHFMALAGMLGLSILAVLFLFFNVNRPLKSIEDAIHKIVVGDYSNIPKISTGDEFESLVTSLNNMIGELNRRSEQLIQTKKLASLGTLTSGVAHELNNPLNNISTSVQILLEELEEGDLEYKRELLTESENQIERAKDIVKALLEFSRERSFSRKQVRFRDLVDNTIRLIKGELPAEVELRVEVPDDIQGNMDARRIQQVLLNLILNGVQALEDGGVLQIKAFKEEEKKEFGFQVRDTGKGISEENLSKIFDPFFTTKEAARGSESGPPAYHGVAEHQGSGLGLSISHGIVEQHGGRIEVESKLGEGTTFTVYLPLESKKGETA
jgi:two-component system NtrC family sensor kinase